MTFKISDSDISLAQLLEIQDFTKETKEKISNADVLILPNFGFRDNKTRCFYAGTSNFLKIARQELSDYSIALCENEGDEKSLTLRSGEIWIPILMISIDPIKDIILPAIINLVTSYIFDRFMSDSENEKTEVHLNVFVENKKLKTTKLLSYDGPPSGLKKLKIDAKDLFKDNDSTKV